MKAERNGSRGVGILILLMVSLLISVGVCLAAPPGQGTLTIIEPDGKPGSGCPLEHTSVKAEISGFVTSVEVKQIFRNPREKKIEAVYTFPLSAQAAVNDMLMKVGDRVVKGVIKRREEARRIYEEARDRGQVASLLDQERPNIFTQSVANIMPGEKVEITIKYVETLPYEAGAFRFVFPMVVGPRFIPGRPTGKQGTGWAKDTTSVPDASRVTPPVAEKGKRAGHDIDITVSIDAGVPIEKIDSKLHEVEIDRKGKTRAVIVLKNKKEIPNRDFVMEYLVAADEVRSGVLTHKDGTEGYLALVIIPPKRVKFEEIAPRELIFIVDRSGSQMGKPLEKCKETMKYVIERMNPDDTFNFIDFANDTRMLFSSPKKNTPETRAKVFKYLDSIIAGGGTRMTGAIWEAMSTDPPQHRLRIVTFMTDGLVGNDFEVISMIKKLRGTSRWFSFGTGNSVNRFLLDNIARVGGGEVDYILLNRPGEEVAKKFYERISAPVLTDVKLSLQGITLDDVYPSVVSDLWSGKPLVFKARYSNPGKGSITVKGFRAGKPYEQTLEVTLPDQETRNTALESLWARAKVDDLVDRDLMGIQRGNARKEIKEQIIEVALAHRIVTQFTSFVAVEETVITKDGKPVKVTVPVELPDGVSREGIFGEETRITGKGTVTAYRYMRRSGSVPASVSGNLYGRPGHPMSAAPSVSARVARKEALPRSFGRGTVTPQPSYEGVKPGDRASIPPKLSDGLAELVKMQDKPLNWSKGKVTLKDGKVNIQVWLKRGGDTTLKKLKGMGLEISFTASTGKMVIGSISVEKLEALSEVDEVRFIEPFVVSG